MIAALICFYAGLKGWRWVTIPVSTAALIPWTLAVYSHELSVEFLAYGIAYTLAIATVGYLLGRGLARLFRLSSAASPSTDPVSGQR